MHATQLENSSAVDCGTYMHPGENFFYTSNCPVPQHNNLIVLTMPLRKYNPEAFIESKRSDQLFKSDLPLKHSVVVAMQLGTSERTPPQFAYSHFLLFSEVCCIQFSVQVLQQPTNMVFKE